MAKLSIICILTLVIVLRHGNAQSDISTTQIAPQSHELSLDPSTRRTPSLGKCTWACRHKKNGCYSRCRWCCKGRTCKTRYCLRKCYKKGCKRNPSRRFCRKQCIQIGRCHRHCNRCCTKTSRGLRCKRQCTKPCYKPGCQMRLRTTRPKRVCRPACVHRGKCFVKCRRCCRGGRCFNSRCKRACFTAGCKTLKAKCSRKCIRRGFCFKQCRRCCKGGKCKIKSCLPKCFYSGCAIVKTTSPPKTCNCRRIAPGTGVCYYFNKNGAPYCEKRSCKPSFKCVSYKTGLKCMRRKVTRQVVPTGPRTCRTKNVISYMFVLYSKY